ncbi:hypothetical protein E1B28_001520 [Marasmius oreades]|uniref:Uncharacterized protein n=1 Tax=Marasmius oreades TaxID=181124 RepID=A0A9P7V3J8_9AGAR|nr:uncharacterized protein E1B28_001520 [Marasmius oreades]KAG7099700.1 hypothetical protein E1B28_001520 [Marasmius oreades]
MTPQASDENQRAGFVKSGRVFEFYEEYPVGERPPRCGSWSPTHKRKVPLYFLGWKMKDEDVLKIDPEGKYYCKYDHATHILEFGIQDIWESNDYHTTFGTISIPQTTVTWLDSKAASFIYFCANLPGEAPLTRTLIDTVKEVLHVTEDPVWILNRALTKDDPWENRHTRAEH